MLGQFSSDYVTDLYERKTSGGGLKEDFENTSGAQWIEL